MGGILLPTACCCIEAADDDCAHCDFTPKYWTVTISGITKCPCTIDGASSYLTSILTGINGTHLLTQWGSDACVWAKENFGTWTLKYHHGTICDNEVAEFSGTIYMWLHRRNASQHWNLRISHSDSVGYEGETFRTIFRGGVDEEEEGDCLIIPGAMSNINSCGVAGDGLGQWWFIASGGTATFEAGDQT